MTYAVLLALALSIDTFVLAISIGLSVKGKLDFSPYKYCFIFGVVQAGLFSIGRIFTAIIPFETLSISQYRLHISSIVFGILAIKMLLEFFSGEDDSEPINLQDIWKIALLTSIDALIVGLTPLKISVSDMILFLAIFIATSIAAFIGIEIARKLKKVQIIEHYSLLIGALLLIALTITSF